MARCRDALFSAYVESRRQLSESWEEAQRMSQTRDIRSVAAPAIVALLLCAAGPVNGQSVMGAEAVQKYNANPLTVAIPPKLGPQEVEEGMVLALRGRKWTVVQQSPQEVVGTLNHRECQAKVMLRV